MSLEDDIRAVLDQHRETDSGLVHSIEQCLASFQARSGEKVTESGEET